MSGEENGFTQGQADLLKIVVAGFIHSIDFNGVPVSGLDKALVSEIEPLVESGFIYVNFGQNGVNPYILMFPAEVPQDNLATLHKLRAHLTDAVLYPTRMVMEQVKLGDRYAEAPYSRELLLGEAQLEPLYFHGAVLERYRNDPRFEYRFDIDGSISSRKAGEEHRLTALGIGFHKDSRAPVVVALRRYLHDMPAHEQQHWRIHRITDGRDYRLHPDFVKPHYKGEFPEKLSPYSAVVAEIDLINKMSAAIGWPSLFNKSFSGANRPKNFGYLIRPTLREYHSFIHELDKILSDNLSLKFLRERLETDGKDENGKDIGSIALLETWLSALVRDDPQEMVPAAIKLFKDVRKLRQRPAHGSDQDLWDEAFYDQQRDKIVGAYYAVRTIRQVLGCHPDAAHVDVPNQLDAPKVWLF